MPPFRLPPPPYFHAIMHMIGRTTCLFTYAHAMPRATFHAAMATPRLRVADAAADTLRFSDLITPRCLMSFDATID